MNKFFCSLMFFVMFWAITFMVLPNYPTIQTNLIGFLWLSLLINCAGICLTNKIFPEG